MNVSDERSGMRLTSIAIRHTRAALSKRR